MQYLNSTCTLIIAIIYIVSMDIVKQSLQDIKSGLDSPKFMAKCFQRHSFRDQDALLLNRNISNMNNCIDTKTLVDILVTPSKVSDLHESNENIVKLLNSVREITLKTLLDTKELNTISYWSAIENKLNDPLETFNLFGFDIDDTTLIKKGVALMTGYILTTNLQNKFGF
jgi:hypothetical protein